MTFRPWLALRVLTLAVCSAAALAQTYPTPNPPYPDPITAFAGRYLDSANVGEFLQHGGKTFRARRIKVAPERDRIYMAFGPARFAIYELSTFGAHLSAPLATGLHGERYLPFFRSLDPEDPHSGWNTNVLDSLDRLADFDWDDRGLTYLSYGPYGWGIVRNETQLISQTSGLAGPILSLKVGDSYFALLSDSATKTRVYDVTDPAAPLFLRNVPIGFIGTAKSADGTVGIVVPGGELRFYNPADLIIGAAPLATFPTTAGRFGDIATDGTRFYVLFNPTDALVAEQVVVFTPTAGGFVPVAYPFPRISSRPISISYGEGYISATGFDSGGTNDVFLFRETGGVLSPLDMGTFFQSFYTGRYILPRDAQVIRSGSNLFLLVAMNGVGDAYLLEVPPVDLAITKSGPATAVGGEQITYSIQVVNQSQAPATNIVVTDSLPANTTFVSVSAPAGFTCSTPSVGSAGTVSCTTAALGAGATATINLVVRIDPAIRILSVENTATVSSGSFEFQSATSNNSGSAAITITASAVIPTLSEWLLLALALSLGIIGGLGVRARG